MLTILKPRNALNKAFLKVKPNRIAIETFKSNLIQLLDKINEKESEEFHKNLISDFLKKTYYDPQHFINTKGRNDLVIHNDKDAKSTVGVIIEAKKPTNRAEMLKADNINAKALQELVLYYLRERITHKNLEIKHLMATNIYEWFVFDAQIFEKAFAQDKNLVKQFTDFEEGRLSSKNTDFFYKEIAEPALEKVKNELVFTHFDIREYDQILRNNDPQDDKQLIALFKLLAPEHLLKLPFANDSNSLDKAFYAELLHIIGLTETKDGSKKLIERKPAGERNAGSLLENVISQLDSLDKISRLEKPSQYGENQAERLFSVGLELVITWVNRILFLKLLEAQLLTYHKGNKEYSFLNLDKIQGFDDLNSLFFGVLARLPAEREADLQKLFEKVPYLNSSLFEPTELEHNALFISNLRDDKKLPILGSTVLKDNTGKRKTGEMKALDYLFAFLNAYDFASEGSEEIQEDNKTLINASVLGLIFEKINGYKDGSFFTPGFITMYMCRETIRRAVLTKFQTLPKFAQVRDFTDLYNKIDDIKEANAIINNLKICDPAVGSGHFLVSALNEIIAIKSDLKILQDRQGRRLKEYQIEVVNDELVLTDEEGKLFEYNPNNRESQRVQETLFQEKQTIIENCLFGVDINPNSVKICRLRLWIELLKNAYYRQAPPQPSPKEREFFSSPPSGELEGAGLETLPNIDINIKCGNSLISRFALDADLKQALKKSKWTIDTYKVAVQTYRNATDKAEKREMERLIADIKSDFRSEITKNDPKLKKLNAKSGELYNLLNQTQLFAESEKDKKERLKKQSQLEKEIEALNNEIEEIKSNKIYENAFEWRFEFPEVLNEEGDFVGFDVVIGNPPYIPLEAFNNSERKFLKEKYLQLERKYESSVPFIIDGLKILNSTGLLSYIAPVTWQTGENYLKFRKYFFDNFGLNKIINLPFDIFDDAYVDTSLYFFTKEKNENYLIYSFDKKAKVKNLYGINFLSFKISELNSPDYKILFDKSIQDFFISNKNNFVELGIITKSTQGLSGSQFPNSEKTDNDFNFPFLEKGNVYNYTLIKESIYYTDLSSKKNLIHFYQAEPKILIRRIINRQDRLSVSYTNEKLVFKKDINPFIPIDPNFDAKYLTAILASKLISYIYLHSSSIASKDDFRQTTLNELRKLLIPKISLNEQKPIINLVEQILDLKKTNPNADTSALEKEIDQLVYELYGLTEEEIRLVEGSN
ncbi:MAG: N-6 DNA methylase [Microscillaceae bacterium]|jgi:hypothetical protein|nr:N-6 DNA methylase [Microscillaceae bacterium]